MDVIHVYDNESFAINVMILIKQLFYTITAIIVAHLHFPSIIDFLQNRFGHPVAIF